MKKVLAGAAMACLATGMLAGPAFADPKGDFVIDLDCGDGVVQIVSPPNEAPWTPGLDINSTTVYQPVGFKDEVGRVEILDGPDAGTVLEFPGGEDSMKNGKRKGVDVQECTFSSEFEGYETELGRHRPRHLLGHGLPEEPRQVAAGHSLPNCISKAVGAAGQPRGGAPRAGSAPTWHLRDVNRPR